MPFILDSPETKVPIVPQEHVIDTYQLHDVNMSFKHDNFKDTLVEFLMEQGYIP